MMKKRLLYAWVLLFFAPNLNAQNCTPDSVLIETYLDGMPDIFPKPDTTLGSFPLNSGCVGENYITTFTFSVPDTIPAMPLQEILYDRAIEYWRIDSIRGLPPGTTYVCEPDSCIFTNTMACVSILGQPSEAGFFFPVIYTNLRAEFFLGSMLNLSINIPSLPDDIIPIYEGNYQIDICPESMCNSCTVGVNDVLENTVNVQQNAPNPFHENTNIIIHSKKSDNFDFRVVNMLGETIHNEQIYLISGENNISFDGSKFPSGVYFYSIGKNGNYTSKKMLIN